MKYLHVLTLLVFAGDGTAAVVTKTPVAPDGTPVQIDLPGPLQLRNKGGSDGAGLCVFTSINHAAYWHNVLCLQNFRDDMTKYPGGGYPQKVDKMVAVFAAKYQQPVPRYIQIESQDIEILKLACRTNRMPSITYSYSPSGRYRGKIAHMVSLVAADAGPNHLWAILDNNFPNSYEWMSEAEFRRTYLAGGQGWSVIFLGPGPPPVPSNPTTKGFP
jgi:hypothetical protein